MIITFILLAATWLLSRASIAPVGLLPQNQLIPAPVVTSASSQYFERIFNRLVFAPPVLEAPLIPFAPAPGPSVTTLPVQTTPAGAQPQPAAPDNNPNVAIAIATAQAAPVATILLPPYPFGPPPAINFIPSLNVIHTDPPNRETEPTTERARTTTPTSTTTTQTQQPSASSSNNNNFLQGLPSNENVKFNQYYAPKPQKVKTSVEVVPVPLAYIAPPPLKLHNVKHAPTKDRIILRPVTSHNSVIRIKVPIRIVRYKYKPSYKPSHSGRKSGLGSLALTNVSRGSSEPTTLRPYNRSNGPSTKPPRV